MIVFSPCGGVVMRLYVYEINDSVPKGKQIFSITYATSSVFAVPCCSVRSRRRRCHDQSHHHRLNGSVGILMPGIVKEGCASTICT